MDEELHFKRYFEDRYGPVMKFQMKWIYKGMNLKMDIDVDLDNINCEDESIEALRGAAAEHIKRHLEQAVKSIC